MSMEKPIISYDTDDFDSFLKRLNVIHTQMRLITFLYKLRVGKHEQQRV